jgi:hypothetical protein
LISCWICAKEHYAKNCPLKQKLNALEKEDNPYVGVLQVLNIVMEGESMESQEKDETKLFYVQAKLNGKSVIAMVDSGVTHNFLREDMVQRLGLQPEPMQTTFKTVNTGVERVIGVAKDISLKLGDWCGKTSFTIVPMDDFEVVLGQEFMRKEKETPIPHMNSLAIFSGQTPCLIPTIRRKEGGTHMSSLQMVVADNQRRKPCGDELGQCGVMVGQS